MTVNREAIIDKLKDLKDKGYIVPSEDMIKTSDEIKKIRKAAKINTELLDLIAKNIKPGMTTDELNTIAHEFIESKGAVPMQLDSPNYSGTHKFPKSSIISVNNEMFYGIPSSDRVLKDGDIVNVIIPIMYDGYCSHESRMFMIGNVSDEAKRLVEVAKECIDKGIEAIKPWGDIRDIVHAVEEHAKVNGYSLFNMIGHGTGRSVREEPIFGSNGIGIDTLFAKEQGLCPNKVGQGMILAPGMAISLEPAINEGKKDWHIDKDNGFTMYTDDGKLSAQWEHTMLVTEDGVEILCK